MNGKISKLEKIDAVCEGNKFIDTDGIDLIINMSKIIQQIKIKNKNEEKNNESNVYPFRSKKYS